MRKEDDGEKERKERKKMLFIVATKVVASQPTEHRPTGVPTTRANCFPCNLVNLSTSPWRYCSHFYSKAIPIFLGNLSHF